MKQLLKDTSGFTIVEMMIVIVVGSLLIGSFTTLYNNNIIFLFNEENNNLSLNQLELESQRIGNVLRGATQIVSASANNLSFYAYFYPSDQYVSLVNYYVNSSNNQVLANVTPMTSNPPIGTPITNETQSYTIIDNYFNPSGTSLFQYYDSGNNLLSEPISSVQSIVGVQINLSAPLAGFSGKNQSLNYFVDLRNMNITI